ncbi:unnamed protein product [Meganyctiphanes norvegica]|uniref:Transmembrane protein n=1 Tax=Meganyctiphanes norvegica TaxID=48144 RepID=A0AAV2QEG3_MEGNR
MSILSPKGHHKSTENTKEKRFWWLADLEDNLAWGVFVFHLGVIPLLLVHSGRAVYWFILPIFVFFCGWIVVRRCGRGIHPCQILAKLALSASCLMLAITVCELMDNMPQVTSAIFMLIIIIILVALPTGYLICKKDEISC